MGVFEPEHDMCISIHALLAESDIIPLRSRLKRAIISIHALLAESDQAVMYIWQWHFAISIHALLAESDQKGGGLKTAALLFLSTLSLRRATLYPMRAFEPIGISIHALLAESDMIVTPLFVFVFYFYPRSPCGERQLAA